MRLLARPGLALTRPPAAAARRARAAASASAAAGSPAADGTPGDTGAAAAGPGSVAESFARASASGPPTALDAVAQEVDDILRRWEGPAGGASGSAERDGSSSGSSGSGRSSRGGRGREALAAAAAALQAVPREQRAALQTARKLRIKLSYLGRGFSGSGSGSSSHHSPTASAGEATATGDRAVPAPPCPRCWLAARFCACAAWPPLTRRPPVTLWLLTHHDELLLAADTIKILLAAFWRPEGAALEGRGAGPSGAGGDPEAGSGSDAAGRAGGSSLSGARLVVAGLPRSEAPLWALLSAPEAAHTAAVLFPAPGAVPAGAHVRALRSRQQDADGTADSEEMGRRCMAPSSSSSAKADPLNPLRLPLRDVIVLDGTWEQARRLNARIPARIPRISLAAPPAAPQHTLRAHPTAPRRIATSEAVGALLTELLTEQRDSRSDSDSADDDVFAFERPLREYLDAGERAYRAQTGAPQAGRAEEPGPHA